MRDWRRIMVGRRLSPEEREIWSRLAQSVRPLEKHRIERRDAASIEDLAIDTPVVAPPKRVKGRVPPIPGPRVATPAPRAPVVVLDDAWERRITSGTIAPEMSVDLHGHTLAAAHNRLNQVLGMAIARGVRVLLVVTGNPRPAPTNAHEPRTRGAIRSEIGDWLALSGHADAIASVRTAHPRHGGKGALYIILRRRK